MLVFTMSQLRRLAADYSAATGVEYAAMGEAAAGNWKLFRRLADGAGCSAKGAESATHWLCSVWPDEVPWPEGVPDLRLQVRRGRAAAE